MKGKLISAILLMIIIAMIVMFFSQKQDIPLGVAVHAHSLLNISICGEHKDLPKVNEHEHYLGTSLLHTHDDNIVHIEGIVNTCEDPTLGAFFDVINVTFSNDKIMNVKNGNLCNGKQAKLKMYINNMQSNAFRNYVFLNTDDPQMQVISLVFEP